MDIDPRFKKETLKLALGTVQFGLNYGINNAKGTPATEELSSILNTAAANGINYLDTASGYGDAESRIGYLGMNRFSIISKFSKTNTSSSLLKQFAQTLAHTKQERIFGYMAHNADELIQKTELWETLTDLKNSGAIEKIGYSLYTPQQLETLLAKGMTPDIVQLPYSLLDRKFESCFAGLKAIGTEIHVRSVFLQGLYFMNTEYLPVRLMALKDSLDELHTICEENNVAVGAIAMNFAIENPSIDRVVIGVDSVWQLETNINMVNSWQPAPVLMEKVKNISVAYPELLNPVNW